MLAGFIATGADDPESRSPQELRDQLQSLQLTARHAFGPCHVFG